MKIEERNKLKATRMKEEEPKEGKVVKLTEEKEKNEGNKRKWENIFE